MARKRKTEEIIGKLRKAELVLAQVGAVVDACRRMTWEQSVQWSGVTLSASSLWR
jgi:hypothetical protein